jgi:hypothetical protein
MKRFKADGSLFVICCSSIFREEIFPEFRIFLRDLAKENCNETADNPSDVKWGGLLLGLGLLLLRIAAMLWSRSAP